MAVRISWNSCVRSTAMSGPPDVLIEEINRILLYALLSSIKNECISIEHWIDLPKVFFSHFWNQYFYGPFFRSFNYGHLKLNFWFHWAHRRHNGRARQDLHRKRQERARRGICNCSKVCTSREKELNGKLPGGISLYIRYSAVISKSGRVWAWLVVFTYGR